MSSGSDIDSSSLRARIDFGGLVDRSLLAADRSYAALKLTRHTTVDRHVGRSRVLADIEPLLRPGDWSLVYPGAEVRLRSIPVAMVRSGAAIPVHIDGPAFTAVNSTTERAQAHRPATIGWTVHDSDFQADVVLIRHSGKRLFFDLERSEVLRCVKEPITSEYETLRRAFSRHVPSVPFGVSPSRRSLTEPLIVGEELGDLPADRKEYFTRALLRSLAELIDREARRDSDAEAVPLHQMAERSPIGEGRQRSKDLVGMLGGSPVTVPVHGELGGSNVLIVDDAPVAIDFDSLHRGVFFHDALLLATTLPQLLVDGGLDEELGGIWEAAGLRPVHWNDENVRLAMLALAVERADRRMRNTRPPIVRLKRRVKAAQERVAWRNRVSSLPGVLSSPPEASS